MPNFFYTGCKTGREHVTGVIEGNDVDEIISTLMRLGITPIRIEERGEGELPLGDELRKFYESLRFKVSVDDLILFNRQMHSLIKAGVPLIRALRGIADITRKNDLGRIIAGIPEELEAGWSLSQTLRRHPSVFPSLMTSLVAMGENTGRLDDAFAQIAIYLEKDKETRKQITSALRYPGFVMVAIAVGMVVINMFVIPAFANMFSKFGSQLPWQTRLLLAVSNFTVAYWPLMFLVMLVAGVAAHFYLKSRSGRCRWDRYKFYFPLVGSIIHRATMARFARAFAMTMRTGVPVLDGLRLSARGVTNLYVEEEINAMRVRVERGESLAQTAMSTGLFTPLVLQMLAVGEESGRVDEMMQEVAEFYEREVDYDIKSLSSAIEPILIIFVCMIVAVMALGVFLPMWEMNSAMQMRH
jgi:MSHA biogenesis protein MshG